MYLLDTNVVSELRRGSRADSRVAGWAGPQPPSVLFLSVMTIFEVRKGVLSLARRDPRQAAILATWLDDVVLPEFSGRILPIDTDTALRCAALHVPDPRPERDAMIAATALEHRLTVVTRNDADFAPMGVRVINPWAM